MLTIACPYIILSGVVALTDHDLATNRRRQIRGNVDTNQPGDYTTSNEACRRLV